MRLRRDAHGGIRERARPDAEAAGRLACVFALTSKRHRARAGIHVVRVALDCVIRALLEDVTVVADGDGWRLRRSRIGDAAHRYGAGCEGGGDLESRLLGASVVAASLDDGGGIARIEVVVIAHAVVSTLDERLPVDLHGRIRRDGLAGVGLRCDAHCGRRDVFPVDGEAAVAPVGGPGKVALAHDAQLRRSRIHVALVLVREVLVGLEVAKAVEIDVGCGRRRIAGVSVRVNGPDGGIRKVNGRDLEACGDFALDSLETLDGNRCRASVYVVQKLHGVVLVANERHARARHGDAGLDGASRIGLVGNGRDHLRQDDHDDGERERHRARAIALAGDDGRCGTGTGIVAIGDGEVAVDDKLDVPRLDDGNRGDSPAPPRLLANGLDSRVFQSDGRDVEGLRDCARIVALAGDGDACGAGIQVVGIGNVVCVGPQRLAVKRDGGRRLDLGPVEGVGALHAGDGCSAYVEGRNREVLGLRTRVVAHARDGDAGSAGIYVVGVGKRVIGALDERLAIYGDVRLGRDGASGVGCIGDIAHRCTGNIDGRDVEEEPARRTLEVAHADDMHLAGPSVDVVLVLVGEVGTLDKRAKARERDGGRGLVRLAGVGERRYRAERGREDVRLADGEGAARGAGGISDARDGDGCFADFDVIAIAYGVVDAFDELGAAHGHEGLGLDFMTGIGMLARDRHGGFRDVEGHDRVGLADGDALYGIAVYTLKRGGNCGRTRLLADERDALCVRVECHLDGVGVIDAPFPLLSRAVGFPARPVSVLDGDGLTVLVLDVLATAELGTDDLEDMVGVDLAVAGLTIPAGRVNVCGRGVNEVDYLIGGEVGVFREEQGGDTGNVGCGHGGSVLGPIGSSGVQGTADVCARRTDVLDAGIVDVVVRIGVASDHVIRGGPSIVSREVDDREARFVIAGIVDEGDRCIGSRIAGCRNGENAVMVGFVTVGIDPDAIAGLLDLCRQNVIVHEVRAVLAAKAHVDDADVVVLGISLGAVLG